MKAITFFVASFFLICTTASADDNDLPHVTVFGTATTEVVPDQMIWSVTVKNKGRVLQDVAKAHGSIVKQVLQLLKDQKVPEAKTQTAQMQFGENQEYKSSSWVKEGYFASTDISFTLDNLEQYRPLWIGLSQIPNVSVQAVQYDHSQRIQYQDETRKKAVMAAREKARMLAEALGSTIEEPLMIEEDLSVNEGWGRAVVTNFRSREGETGMPEGIVSPGKIPIRARVRATFRLVTQDQ